jgi:hypothetical protein
VLVNATLHWSHVFGFCRWTLNDTRCTDYVSLGIRVLRPFQLEVRSTTTFGTSCLQWHMPEMIKYFLVLLRSKLSCLYPQQDLKVVQSAGVLSFGTVYFLHRTFVLVFHLMQSWIRCCQRCNQSAAALSSNESSADETTGPCRHPVVCRQMIFVLVCRYVCRRSKNRSH